MLKLRTNFDRPTLLRSFLSEAKKSNRLAYSSNKRSMGTDKTFSHGKLGAFTQEPPELRNPFVEDPILSKYIKHYVQDTNHVAYISKDLLAFGDRIVREIDKLGRECDVNLPKLEKFDAWGNRVDRIHMCSAWHRMKEISATEGLVAIGYEKKTDKWSRLHQFAKLYLFGPSSGLYNCPLAMTDGASKVIQELGLKELTGEAFSRLTSRDPNRFWTSGQWMTEKRGGSDVGGATETVAHENSDYGNTSSLFGYKWFSSATDADMALTLARPINDQGKYEQGSKGLELFFVEVRNGKTGQLNGIEVIRLKDKLGTRQVPTAELLLEKCIAKQLTHGGRGISAVSHMLNTTRLYNAVSSVGGMRRMINLARDYMGRRRAFGKLIKDHPLHAKTLASMEIEARGCLLLVMLCTRLLGRQECGGAVSDDLTLMRLLFPIIKLYTGKKAVAIASEGLECFGGAGYLEDTGLPRILRDAQEGTTNVLCLDVIRVLSKDCQEVLKAISRFLDKELACATSPQLVDCAKKIRSSFEDLKTFILNNPQCWEAAGRDLAFSFARIIGGACMTSFAAIDSNAVDEYACLRWCFDAQMCCTAEPESYPKQMEMDRRLLTNAKM